MLSQNAAKLKKLVNSNLICVVVCIFTNKHLERIKLFGKFHFL